jgi:hypothetical protein
MEEYETQGWQVKAEGIFIYTEMLFQQKNLQL